jgi:hypothetical protein
MNVLCPILALLILALPACRPKHPEIPSEPEAAAYCALPEGAYEPYPEQAGREGPEGTILLHMPLTDHQQPRVPFRHDTHGGLACENCHSVRKSNLVLRIDFTQTCPHGLCLGCHQGMSDRGLHTGPLTCSGCHRGRTGS